MIACWHSSFQHMSLNSRALVTLSFDALYDALMNDLIQQISGSRRILAAEYSRLEYDIKSDASVCSTRRQLSIELSGVLYCRLIGHHREQWH